MYVCVYKASIYGQQPTGEAHSYVRCPGHASAAPVVLGCVCSPAIWWPWANHLPSAVRKKPTFFLSSAEENILPELECDDNNCIRSLGWTSHWGVLGLVSWGVNAKF